MQVLPREASICYNDTHCMNLSANAFAVNLQLLEIGVM